MNILSDIFSVFPQDDQRVRDRAIMIACTASSDYKLVRVATDIETSTC